uniref:SRA stem-loop interacting RNA binding protein n=1 Tax=Falco tinnunculus TaxID=100819 RepID=A0A8C4UYV4_FALTI
MAAASAVRVVRRSRRLFDLFVTDVPWTVSNSESAPPASPPPVGGRQAGRQGGGPAACAGTGRGAAGGPGPCNPARVSPTEELKEYFSQFGSVQRCQLPFDKDTGFHRRYCWIKFSTRSDLQNVFQQDSHILEGARLTLKQLPYGRHSQRKNQSE